MAVRSEPQPIRDPQTGQVLGKRRGENARLRSIERRRMIREAEARGEIVDPLTLPQNPVRPTPLPLPLAEDRVPWERQPKETSRAYYCFTTYRDLGPFDRSVRKTAMVLGVGRTVPQRLSLQWRWEERAAEWDAQKKREFDATRKDEQEKAVKSHVNASRALLNLSVKLLQIQQQQAAPDGRVLRDAALSLDKAIHHHRLALGLPTEMSRQDQYLKSLIEEMVQNQTNLMALLEEVLCDDCRASAATEIRRLRQKVTSVESRAS